MISWVKVSFARLESSEKSSDDRIGLEVPNTGDVAREANLEARIETYDTYLRNFIWRDRFSGTIISPQFKMFPYKTVNKGLLCH